MTYPITAKNLFSATIILKHLESLEDISNKHTYKRHSSIFIEVSRHHIEYSIFTHRFKNDIAKLVRKEKLKNSTKYTTMEL